MKNVESNAHVHDCSFEFTWDAVHAKLIIKSLPVANTNLRSVWKSDCVESLSFSKMFEMHLLQYQSISI